MIKKITLLLLFSLFVITFLSNGQDFHSEPLETGGDYPLNINNSDNPCITPDQYKIIEKQNIENCRLLGLKYGMQKKSMTTVFSWPLRTANGLNDCSYYYIGNYLDQDTTSPGIRDYNCGAVTYDGHQGTDICIWPYPFYKMDNDEVEVIAAAPGTIINRVDGNFDKNCAFNNLTANYVTIQHADGSCAMYWHMKMNTVTAKTIGQTVVAGEYLGKVGSSGSSTAPHLHFEVLSGITINTLNDSYAGPCNTLNANSWWAVQKPYTEPAIVEASVHPTLAVFPACPATEIPNEDTCFSPGSSTRFYIFIRNETTGMTANMRIVNPGGTTFTSWTHNSNSNHLISYWITTQTLPTTAGTYTFEASYNGQTCSKIFYINCASSGIHDLNDLSGIDIYPNPSGSDLNISGYSPGNGNYYFILRNMIGQIILSGNDQISNNKISKNISLPDLKDGVYFLTLQTDKVRTIRKLIIKNH